MNEIKRFGAAASVYPEIAIGLVKYGKSERIWFGQTAHYLGNPPPGCLFAIGVSLPCPGLFGPQVGGKLLGLCLVGRPVARRLPQDGTCGEIIRMWLAPGLPFGTASAVLRYAAAIALKRGMKSLIAYHDRTRHTGCIYRKAGFKKDGTTAPPAGGWGSRGGRISADYETTPKRRWRLVLVQP